MNLQQPILTIVSNRVCPQGSKTAPPKDPAIDRSTMKYRCCAELFFFLA